MRNFRCSTALEKEHWQWQFSDPASAIARKGFRPGQKQNLWNSVMLIFMFFFFFQGLYGRLDKDYVFQTTVTNVEPTAKQSRVLNPYVRRCRMIHDVPSSVRYLFLFILSFPGFAVPSYGHGPRTGALARIPRLVCLLLYQRQCRHSASNTSSFLPL